MHKHKKIARKASAGIVTAAMLASTVAASAPSVFAGMCVGESTFETKGLPWHTCETSPAKQNFDLDLKNGVYRTEIVEPGGQAKGGESRWDLQFRHRKLKIQSGHKYKIHWEVTASNDGEMATHIAPLSGENPVWHNNQDDDAGKAFGQSWDNVIIKKGKNEFDAGFTATESLEVAEWAFHYGGAGPHQPKDCFPAGTILEFDNMTLECETCGSTYKEGSCLWDPSDTYGMVSRKNSGLADNYISVNQVGYFTKLAKKATIGDNAGAAGNDIPAISLPTSPVEFKVVGSGGTAYTGKSTYLGKDADSGDNCHVLDFSELQEPGTYHIECEGYKSFDFKIGDDIYSEKGHDLLTNAMNYYYQNRSGIAIEASYITSGEKSELAHPAGHKTDDAYVQPVWQNEYKGEFDGDTSYSIDCVGGWYDAGDHGKYVVNGGVSVWTLQNLYERSLKLGTEDKFADGSGAVVIPESGDSKKVPDILDETRYELDWMMKMVVKEKDPHWGDYAGLVYHKMHDHKWTGLATKPWDYISDWGTTRIVKPPSLAATANFAACAAQASRLWEPYDSAYAKTLLDAAKTSYEAFKKHFYEYGTKPGENDSDGLNNNKTSLYAPGHHAKGGGPYGDDKATDDGYWAACELYATTGDESYLEDAKGGANFKYEAPMEVVTLLEGGENASSFSSFNWGCTGSLGSLSLYLNKDKLKDEADIASLEKSITSAADTYIAKEDEQGYGIPYRGSKFTDPNNIGKDKSGKWVEVEGYEWGSNSFVINNAIVMAYAYDVNDGDTKYINGVTTAMDYLLGRNPLSYSFITGYGDYCLKSPHHRFWSKELDPEFPACPDGVLSGGCGSGLQDPYVAGLGYKRGEVAPQRCYVDSCEAWSVNEVTINWNAPLVWVASFLQDEGAGDHKTPTPKPTTEPTTTEEPEETTTTEKDEPEVTTTTEKDEPEVTTTTKKDDPEPEKTTTKKDDPEPEKTTTKKDDPEPEKTTTKKDDPEPEKTTTKEDDPEPEKTTTKKGDEPDVTTTKKPTTTRTTTTTKKPSTDGPTVETGNIKNAVWGDVNEDGYITIADMVALNLFLLNSDDYPVTPQGQINANVSFDDWVNTTDSSLLMNYLAEIIDYKQLGPQK